VRFSLISFVVLVILAKGFVCSAQCPSDKRQVEITASYGIISGGQLSNGLSENNQTITYSSGAAFITARYFLYNRLALGVAGGEAAENGQFDNAYSPSTITSSYKQTVTTIAAELYYVYLFRKYLELYTFFGVGPGFTSTTTVTNPTSRTAGYTTIKEHDALRAQYTPIGIRVGGRLGFFGEFGLGYKGVLNAGISFKFGPSCWWRE
jgi:hypothetical protein